MGNQQGYHSAFADQYNRIQNYVLRPKRQVYHPDDLGPAEFTFGGVPFVRTDLCLRNPRGLVLQCSHWRQAEGYLSGRAGPRHYTPPFVVYCHANAGCRLESFDVLTWALESGASLFAFDFAGCGISQGEHVSLGWYEQHDLRTVMDFLRQQFPMSRVVVWGRSMGAVTSMLYGDQTRNRPEVSGMVLDSPFSDFSTVASDLVESRSKKLVGPLAAVPSFVAQPLVSMLSSSIKSAAGFDPSELDLLTVAGRASIPALFVVAENDDFVPPEHGKRLYNAYGGATGILLFTGGHNTRRPLAVYETAARFLEPAMMMPPEARRPVVTVHLNAFRRPWEPPCGEVSNGWLSSLLSAANGPGTPRAPSFDARSRSRAPSFDAHSRPRF